MTKKLPAVTLVLVLAAGFGAVAAQEDGLLTGSWYELILRSQAKIPGNDLSTLETAYASAIVYTSKLGFDKKGGEKYE